MSTSAFRGDLMAHRVTQRPYVSVVVNDISEAATGWVAATRGFATQKGGADQLAYRLTHAPSGQAMQYRISFFNPDHIFLFRQEYLRSRLESIGRW